MVFALSVLAAHHHLSQGERQDAAYAAPTPGTVDVVGADIIRPVILEHKTNREGQVTLPCLTLSYYPRHLPPPLMTLFQP